MERGFLQHKLQERNLMQFVSSFRRTPISMFNPSLTEGGISSGTLDTNTLCAAEPCRSLQALVQFAHFLGPRCDSKGGAEDDCRF
jgi:hypothetical protein